MSASLFRSSRRLVVQGQARSLAQRGGSLIEVLVTMVILMVGLLGLVGLMVQAQRGQVESYQRIQALVVLQDMVSRINANRQVGACYVIGTYMGTGSTVVPACALGTEATQQATAVRDLNEWQSLLLGSAEISGGANAGAMIGARGCVALVSAGVYRVTVAWQGLTPTIAPPANADPAVNIPCGKDLYDTDGTDRQRRVVYQDVQVVDLIG
jgi:type IV pilus assembly protein PilV